jgi:serine/threonine-protein kinase
MRTEPPASTAPVREGDVIADKYVVERVLGVGGMGVVVAAHHRFLGKRVALKFVLPQLASTAGVVPRFLKEAQASTRIASEHVARVMDVGTLDGGVPYMVMEYLEGRDVGSLLAERGPLPVAHAVDYLLQALQAIAEAHAKGIVHRDIKPSNLFLTQRADGSPLVKVLDFGIAKAVLTDALSQGARSDVTGTSGTLGSPLYMSPEQIRSTRSVDARADVWSCGVVLQELLSGTLPFVADAAGALLAAIIADPPVPLRSTRPDLPEVLERAILGCLEKDPARRTPSAWALAQQIAPFGSEDARLSLTRISGIERTLSSRMSGDTGLVQSARSAVAATPPAALTGGGWGDSQTGKAEIETTVPRRRLWPLVLAGAVVVVVVVGLLRYGSEEARVAEVEPVAKPSASAPSLPAAARVLPPVEPTPTPSNVASAAPSATASAPPVAASAKSHAPPRPRAPRPTGLSATAARAPAPTPKPTAPKPTSRPKASVEDLINAR